ncbi:MAG: hypothetical protein EBV86_10285, partial [Marivivens sp.]|nr:hypothetical protein [Marivivens sp.]
TVADYAAIGVAGVTSLNVEAINSSLAEAGVLDSITTSVAPEVQDIVNTWAKVEALADGEQDTVEVGSQFTSLVPTSGWTQGADTNTWSSAGVTVTTDSTYLNQSSNYLKNAFDGDVGTIWGHSNENNGTHWIEMVLPSSVAVTKYMVQSVNHSTNGITDWKLQFWDENLATPAWVDLDTRSGQSITQANYYELTSPKLASKYRLAITDTGISDISELQL